MEGPKITLLAISALLFLAAGIHGKAAQLQNPIEAEDQGQITLKDVLNRKYAPRGFDGTWISDTEVQYNYNGSVFVYNIQSNASNPIINKEWFEGYTGRRILTLSPDSKFILVTHSIKPLWRHSFYAKYDLFDVATKTFEKLVPLSEPGSQAELQLVKWGPVGSAFAYVYGNNIYYRVSAQSGTNTIQLTTDGSSTISNGHTDWVYEEEMFGDATALWFSPQGTHLAFVTFDDTAVEPFQYPIYGEPGDLAHVYPSWVTIRYPKVGYTNPTATVKVVALSSTNPSQIKEAQLDSLAEDKHYVGTVGWVSDTQFLVSTFNRFQNLSRFYLCQAQDGSCPNIYTREEAKGWINNDGAIPSTTGKEFLILQNQFQPSEKLTFSHVTLFSSDPTVKPRAITSGPYSVRSILSWDEAKNEVWFSARGFSSGKPNSNHTHIYKQKIGKAEEPIASPTCVTCALENADKIKCLTNSGRISKEHSYFIHVCEGPGIPETLLRSTKITNDDGSIVPPVKVFADNNELRTNLQGIKLPKTRDYEIPIEGSNFKIRARLTLPPNFHYKNKYPLLVNVYGGPDQIMIQEKFGVHWGTSLATRGVIHAEIDGRGSGGESVERIFEVYRKLGTYEVQDQISAVKWLVQNTGFVDGNRTGIWGWSYGGYVTAMAMAIDKEDVFKCGISVAPVTNWLYYDTIYTERYMDLPTPEDNLIGYNQSDVTTQVENFRKKQYFLIHGNADDNVHYQQSMILARALEKADILFHQLSYPDEDHSISGPNMRSHLFHSVEKFLFSNCFAQDRKNDPGNSGASRPGTVSGIMGPLTAIILITVSRAFL